jgi:hypothetical protein
MHELTYVARRTVEWREAPDPRLRSDQEAIVAHLVVVPWCISCGTCDHCRGGLTAHCTSVPHMAMYGAPIGGSWGGLFSDLVRVPYADAMLVPLPNDGPLLGHELLGHVAALEIDVLLLEVALVEPLLVLVHRVRHLRAVEVDLALVQLVVVDPGVAGLGQSEQVEPVAGGVVVAGVGERGDAGGLELRQRGLEALEAGGLGYALLLEQVRGR